MLKIASVVNVTKRPGAENVKSRVGIISLSVWTEDQGISTKSAKIKYLSLFTTHPVAVLPIIWWQHVENKNCRFDRSKQPPSAKINISAKLYTSGVREHNENGCILMELSMFTYSTWHRTASEATIHYFSPMITLMDVSSCYEPT